MPDANKSCDEPGCVNPASVHLTTVVDDKISMQHLCEACAAQKGISGGKPPQNFALSDFLAQLGEESQGGRASDAEPCSFCGLTLSMFKDTGRLGCPHCYAAFDGHLRGLLRRIHGGTQHVGKVYLPTHPTASDVEKRLDALRRRLMRAVSNEDFERAAVLRDQIRALEPSG